MLRLNHCARFRYPSAWACLCQAPFTPLANCRPAYLAPVGETSWRIEMLTSEA
jgi:hypothetical protein